jgi:methyl-accepting chemotaxis protein
MAGRRRRRAPVAKPPVASVRQLYGTPVLLPVNPKVCVNKNDFITGKRIDEGQAQVSLYISLPNGKWFCYNIPALMDFFEKTSMQSLVVAGVPDTDQMVLAMPDGRIVITHESVINLTQGLKTSRAWKAKLEKKGALIQSQATGERATVDIYSLHSIDPSARPKKETSAPEKVATAGTVAGSAFWLYKNQDKLRTAYRTLLKPAITKAGQGIQFAFQYLDRQGHFEVAREETRLKGRLDEINRKLTTATQNVNFVHELNLNTIQQQKFSRESLNTAHRAVGTHFKDAFDDANLLYHDLNQKIALGIVTKPQMSDNERKILAVQQAVNAKLNLKLQDIRQAWLKDSAFYMELGKRIYEEGPQKDELIKNSRERIQEQQQEIAKLKTEHAMQTNTIQEFSHHVNHLNGNLDRAITHTQQQNQVIENLNKYAREQGVDIKDLTINIYQLQDQLRDARNNLNQANYRAAHASKEAKDKLDKAVQEATQHLGFLSDSYNRHVASLDATKANFIALRNDEGAKLMKRGANSFMLQDFMNITNFSVNFLDNLKAILLQNPLQFQPMMQTFHQRLENYFTDPTPVNTGENTLTLYGHNPSGQFNH